MNNINNKLIVIAGPTCSGKSDIAIELSKIIDAEIVSCDSMQIYKGLDIGTAKVTKDEMGNIKHYMIDICSPKDNFDIKQFSEMAKEYIYKIQNKNKIPILVGGTGYYIKSVIYENNFLFEDENLKNTIINEINNDIEKYGFEYIYEELKKVDIESTKRIHINNKKRVIRALLFYKLHNMRISEFNDIENKKTSPYKCLNILLETDRDTLYKRINDRVDKMIDNGLLNEICSLINLGVSKDCNSMQAIGYKELYDYCNENMAKIQAKSIDFKNDNRLKSLVEKVKQNSRNYAKRQLTWFNAQKNFLRINTDEFSSDKKLIAKEIFTKNKNFLSKNL